MKDFKSTTYQRRQPRMILAVLFFLCLFILGLFLSLWQYKRYKEKLLIETSLSQENAAEHHPHFYQPFEIQAFSSPNLIPVKIQTGDARRYDIYCPVEFSIDNVYLKLEDQLERDDPSLELLASYCKGYLFDVGSIKVAKFPLKHNIFIPKRYYVSDGSITTTQLTLVEQPRNYYLQMNPSLTIMPMRSSTHLGYAFQWLLLAGLSLSFCLRLYFRAI